MEVLALLDDILWRGFSPSLTTKIRAHPDLLLLLLGHTSSVLVQAHRTHMRQSSTSHSLCPRVLAAVIRDAAVTQSDHLVDTRNHSVPVAKLVKPGRLQPRIMRS